MITDLQFVLVLLVYRPVMSYMSTPNNPLVRFVGEDALFYWTTSDGKKIYSAKFGIAEDNIPNPKFIDVNVYTNIVHFKKGMDPRYRNRVDFIGNLTAGRAWFILKNLTINDTNEYIAMVRDELGIFPYTVKLEVKEKDHLKSTPLTTKLLSVHSTTRSTLRSIITVLTSPVPPTTTSVQGYHSPILIIVLTFVMLVTLTVTMLVCVIVVKRGYSRRTCTHHDVSIIERQLLSVKT